MLTDSLLNKNQKAAESKLSCTKSADDVSAYHHSAKRLNGKPAKLATIQDSFPAAAFFYIVSMAFSASQSVFGKMLFTSQPEMSPYQLLAYRAIVSTLINGLTVNVRAREILWDSIPSGGGK